MAKYEVKFCATYSGYVDVEADSAEEAENKIFDELDDAGIFLELHTTDAEYECNASPIEEEMDE